MCTNETAYPILGVPETYITISNRSSHRKRQIDDYPTGIIRLANATLYFLSYPTNQYDFHVLPCATADNMATDDESPTTNEIGKNMIFLPKNIMVTKNQHCIHKWGTENSISVNHCSSNEDDITYSADTYRILTENFINQQLTPLKIIQKDTNLCLTTQPTSSRAYVLLSNCSDSADQFFIIDRTFQTSKKLMHAKSPKTKKKSVNQI